jgi:hypothetical protein
MPSLCIVNKINGLLQHVSVYSPVSFLRLIATFNWNLPAEIYYKPFDDSFIIVHVGHIIPYICIAL